MGKALGLALWLLVIGVVLMFLAHVYWQPTWWFPLGISAHAGEYDSQFSLTLVVVAIGFILAQCALGFVVFSFGSRRPGKATYSHGNNKLEVTWTLVTLVVFATLAVMGQKVWAELHFHEAPPGSINVEVTAQQFAWNFRYPGPDNVFGKTDPKLIDASTGNPLGLDDQDPAGKDDVVTSTLSVPVNRPVHLILRSQDVTHSFFVPNLRFKQDLVPGMGINVHFTPTVIGHYEIACAELCGLGHYKMKSFMDVMSEEDFAKWLKDRAPAQ
ncbi:MAG TPA: cytochrome c oxidase subunit II [Blastocatellia bacterium]